MAIAILNTEAVIAFTGPEKQKEGPEGKKVGGSEKGWETAECVSWVGVTMITIIYIQI